MEIKLTAIQIEKPEPVNFILGQTHFIKSVEDIHEALVGAVPGIKFGLAFCEASGKCLVRWTGTEPAMIELAERTPWPSAPGTASSCSSARAFTLSTCSTPSKWCPRSAGFSARPPTRPRCSSLKPPRGAASWAWWTGPPKGVEAEPDIEWRKKFLRQIGYKL